jgi:TIR domain
MVVASMATIMLSYRREDSKWVAGRIFDRLETHYGKGNVFMDIDAIPVGLDFREHLQQSLQRCDILVAIIGPRWVGTDEHGHHAIAEESDWVRIEIETALEKKIPVIPLLIDRVRMPKANELPESLRNFAFRQAAEVDSGVDFRTHMDRLIRAMDQYLQRRSERPTARTQAPDAQPDWSQISSAKSSPAQSVRTELSEESESMLPSRAVRAALRSARYAANSWGIIAGFLFGSELVGLLLDQVTGNNNNLFFIALVPLGAVGLILIGLRFFDYLKSLPGNANVSRAALVLGVLAVASVPSFFHATSRPDRYAFALAWPIILLGGLGLILIMAVLISHLSDAQGRGHRLRTWVVFGVVSLSFGWLDSNPTSTYLPMIDWRVRSVLIFTCVMIGSAIFAVIILWLLLRIARNSSINNLRS